MTPYKCCVGVEIHESCWAFQRSDREPYGAIVAILAESFVALSIVSASPCWLFFQSFRGAIPRLMKFATFVVSAALWEATISASAIVYAPLFAFACPLADLV